MINVGFLVIVCRKSVTRLQNKTILRVCEIRSQCVSFAPLIKLKVSLSYPIVFHMFLIHPTAKICRDFSTCSPSLILRELRLSFTKLYIFYQIKNVQSIVDRRN